MSTPIKYQLVQHIVKADNSRVHSRTSYPSDEPLPVPELGDECDIGSEGVKATVTEIHHARRVGEDVHVIVWQLNP